MSSALQTAITSYIETLEPERIEFTADDSCRLTLALDRAIVLELIR